MNEPVGNTGGERPDLGLGRLADPGQFHEPIDIAGREGEALLPHLERMMLIRRVEESIGDMVSSGEVQCPCHLCIGQEACAVGIASALDAERDRVFGAHRSHGHYLALGGDPFALLAEVLGKSEGCSGGMGGSMHVLDTSVGLYGTVPIVGATIPIAVGAGLAAKLRGDNSVSVSFFGDGACEEGVFHESLNLASTHSLPVIFVCENNLFSSHLHISLRQPHTRVSRHAEAHGVAAECLDGNDVVAVEAAAARAVERARSGRGPSFLELVTYRWRGHVGPREDLDVGVRRGDDLDDWKGRDPIRRLAEALDAAGVLDEGRHRSLRNKVDRAVEDAVTRARSAPYPDPSATLHHVHAEPAR